MNESPPQKPVKSTTEKPHRAVKSFVLRAGRLTEGQKRALDELWPLYGLAENDGLI